MKKNRKIMVAVLSLCIAGTLSAAPVFAQDGSVSNVYVIASNNNGNDPTMTVNVPGDVVDNGEAQSAVYVYASSVESNPDPVTATANIQGDVINENNSQYKMSGITTFSRLSDSGNATTEAKVKGSITVGSDRYNGTATGIQVGEHAGMNSADPPEQGSTTTSTVNAGGSVEVSSATEAIGIDVEMFSGDSGYTVESTVDVGEDVKVTAGNEALGISINQPNSYDPGKTSATIHVGGDVNVKSTGNDGQATGIVIWDKNDSSYVKNINANVKVDGSVNAEAAETGSAKGIDLQVEENSNVDISVSEDVYATTIGANIQSQNGAEVKIHVGNDLLGDKCGLQVLSSGQEDVIDVVVENILSGGDKTIVTRSQSSLNALQLTVWKAEVNADGHIVHPGVGVEMNDDAIEAKEKEFLYIIKVEQPTAGGTLSLSQENGNPLRISHDYLNVAKQDEKVLLKVNVEDGYQITGAYNGSEKLSLYKDQNNVYYVAVPKGGGVFLTATFEKLQEQKQEDKKEEKKPEDKKEEEKKPEQQETQEQTTVPESEAVQPGTAGQPVVNESSIPQQEKPLLEKEDMKQGAKITFAADGTFTLQRYDETTIEQRITGTFAVKNGAIELTLPDGTTSRINKDGMLILRIGEAWMDYRSLPEDDMGTCHFEFTSDDLAVLLSVLIKDSTPYTITDTTSQRTMELYQNGVYRVTYQSPDNRDAEYGTFRLEKQEENGTEKIIFTNVKGEEMIFGEDGVLAYKPLQGDSEETFEFKDNDIVVLKMILGLN